MEREEEEEITMKIELKSYGDFENIDSDEAMLAEKILKDQTLETVNAFVSLRDSVKNVFKINRPLLARDFDDVIKLFIKNKAVPFQDVYETGKSKKDKFFACIGHTDLIADCMDIEGCKITSRQHDYFKYEYQDKELDLYLKFVFSPLYDPEEQIGIKSDKLLSGRMIPKSRQKADVYSLIFIARDAYGIGEMESNKLKILNMNHLAVIKCPVWAQL